MTCSRYNVTRVTFNLHWLLSILTIASAVSYGLKTFLLNYESSQEVPLLKQPYVLSVASLLKF